MNEIETKRKECEFCGAKENCNNYWLGKEEARKEFLNSEAIKDFTDYCIDVRGDWSDFDGRELLKVWIKTLEKLKQSLEEKHD
jgi:hypothetical protein